MASHGLRLYNLFSETVFGPATQPMKEKPFSADRYRPSTQDVVSVKKSLMGLQLPLELIDTIIDRAEYWPHITTVRSGTQISARAGTDNENRFILRSYPLGFAPGEDEEADYQMTDQYQANFTTLLPQPWAEDREVPHNATDEVLKAWSATTQPRSEHPCRKIVFTIVSHDQGWGGPPRSKGQYDGSFSWFDVGKEELSAFQEAAALEAWELAPWPQFRLHYRKESERPVQIQSITFTDISHLVCSLRTVVPPTIPRTEDTHDVENEEDGENENENENENDDEQEDGFQAPQPQEVDQQSPAPSISSKPKYQFNHDLCPTGDVLQKNVIADQKFKTHTITWSYDDNIQPESVEGNEFDLQGRGRNTGRGEYVRNLKMGDCVTIWAKARFPGWINVVEKVEIDVYWAI